MPRYNRFLELMHKKPIRSFDDLANPQHPGLPEELRRIYGQTDGRDNVDRIDPMVGLFCETRRRASASATPRSASSS